MGVSRPSQVDKFAHFRGGNLKLNVRRRTRKNSSAKIVSRVAVCEAAGGGVLQEGSMGGHQDKALGTTVAIPSYQMV